MNTFRLSLYELQNAFTTLISSEKGRLKILDSKLNWLFYTGMCIILIFGSFLIIIMNPLHVNLKAIWSKFQSGALKNSANIRYALNNRLNKYHDMEDNVYPQESDSHTSIAYFAHIKHYILRLSLVLILGLILYFVLYFVSFAYVRERMLYKLDFAESIMNRRVYLFQRNYFLMELFADSKGAGIISMYGFTPLPNSKTGYSFIVKKMIDTRRDIFSSNVQNVMRKNIWNENFAFIEDQNGFLKYGLNSAVAEANWESAFVSTNYMIKDFSIYKKIFQELKDFMMFINMTANYTDDSSTIYLEEAFDGLAWFMAVSLGFLLAIMVCYTLPYFYKEQGIIKSMEINENYKNNSNYSDGPKNQKQKAFYDFSKSFESTKNMAKLI